MRVWEDLGGSLRVWGFLEALEASASIQEGLARTWMVVERPGGAEWNWEVSEGDGRGIMVQGGLGETEMAWEGLGESRKFQYGPDGSSRVQKVCIGVCAHSDTYCGH